MRSEKERLTKKQHRLLMFVDQFIQENGYSPSYREIMNGCRYSSLATVALHVKSLVESGHIVKKSHSARSLEVVKKDASSSSSNPESSHHTHNETLIKEIEKRLKHFEKNASQEILDEVYVLVGALKVLGYHDQAYEYAVHLHGLK